MPFKHDAFMNHEAWGSDIPYEPARCAQFNPFACGEVPRDFAFDDDGFRMYLRVDDRAVADDNCVLRADFAVDATIDLHAAFERQFPFYTTALAEMCLD